MVLLRELLLPPSLRRVDTAATPPDRAPLDSLVLAVDVVRFLRPPVPESGKPDPPLETAMDRDTPTALDCREEEVAPRLFSRPPPARA